MTSYRSVSLSSRQRAWRFGLRSLPIIAAAWFAVTHPIDARAGDRQRDRGDEAHPDLIFHNYCSVCHGDRGDGRSRAANSLMPPPKDFTSAATIAELGRARMITSVTYGRPGTAMAAWRAQLSDREIEAVVDYIRKTIMEPNAELAGGRGEAIYAAHCASCHGPTGRGVLDHATGARRAPDLATPAASQTISRSRMIDAVVNGKSGTMMIDYGQKLASSDIEAVVDYMRTAFMLPVIEGLSGIKARGDGGAAAPADQPKPAVDMDAPMPNKLQGDALKGQAFFLGNCATCHGFQGDGKGPRAYFINPRPRDFLEAASRARLNRPALFEAISNGRFGAEMPAWGKVLSEAEIADVAEFVFEEFIRPKKAAQEAAAAK